MQKKKESLACHIGLYCATERLGKKKVEPREAFSGVLFENLEKIGCGWIMNGV
jgi:hypothetical protein